MQPTKWLGWGILPKFYLYRWIVGVQRIIMRKNNSFDSNYWFLINKGQHFFYIKIFYNVLTKSLYGKPTKLNADVSKFTTMWRLQMKIGSLQEPECLPLCLRTLKIPELTIFLYIVEGCVSFIEVSKMEWQVRAFHQRESCLCLP